MTANPVPTTYPQVSKIAGSELVQVIPTAIPGQPPTFLYATANQLGFAQGDTVTASATAGAATANAYKAMITSESLSTAAGSVYTLTLTNNVVATTSIVHVSVFDGTNTTNYPQLVTVTPAAGSVVIIVKNIHASAALNGTIKLAVVVFN